MGSRDPMRQWTPWTVLRIALCCLTPTMIALSFPRLGWSFLAPVALVPLLVGTTRIGVFRSALWGWLGGIVGYSVACTWMFEAIQRFQGLTAPQAILPFLVIQAYHGAQFGVFAGATTWLRGGRRSVPAIATASCWGLLEWLYPKLAPWSLGALTIDWLYFPQAADLVGTSGLGFLVAATSAVVFNALAGSAAARKLRHVPWFVLAASYGCAILYGALRARHFETHESGLKVEVAIVQAALPVGDPDPQRASARSWRAYAEQTAQQEASNVDLVLWPETTIRDYLRHGSAYAHRLRNLAAELGAPVILGALDLPEDYAGEFSAVYVVDEEGTMQRAHKLRLLPFGEYIPGRDWIPWFSSWETTGGFRTGIVHPVLRASGLEIASSICFEALYAGFNNEDLRHGANILVNLSDDTRFGDTSAPHMHLQAARWRALEARRWLLRASNSGISAVISPTGEIVASLAFGEAGVIRETVYAETALTPFVRWGSWFRWVELALFAVAFSRRMLRETQNQN